MKLGGRRLCDYHPSAPIEGPTVTVGTLTYIVLLCPDCDRERGLRLVRRPR